MRTTLTTQLSVQSPGIVSAASCEKCKAGRVASRMARYCQHCGSVLKNPLALRTVEINGTSAKGSLSSIALAEPTLLSDFHFYEVFGYALWINCQGYYYFDAPLLAESRLRRLNLQQGSATNAFLGVVSHEESCPWAAICYELDVFIFNAFNGSLTRIWAGYRGLSLFRLPGLTVKQSDTGYTVRLLLPVVNQEEVNKHVPSDVGEVRFCPFEFDPATKEVISVNAGTPIQYISSLSHLWYESGGMICFFERRRHPVKGEQSVILGFDCGGTLWPDKGIAQSFDYRDDDVAITNASAYFELRVGSNLYFWNRLAGDGHECFQLYHLYVDPHATASSNRHRLTSRLSPDHLFNRPSRLGAVMGHGNVGNVIITQRNDGSVGRINSDGSFLKSCNNIALSPQQKAFGVLCHAQAKHICSTLLSCNDEASLLYCLQLQSDELICHEAFAHFGLDAVPLDNRIYGMGVYRDSRVLTLLSAERRQNGSVASGPKALQLHHYKLP